MLRDFLPGDQEQLRWLILAGLRERWGETFDASVNPDLDDILVNYVDRGAEVVVIEAEGELVATGTLVPDGGCTGRIVRMSVAAAYRRRGLARHIVEDLIARARRRGMSEVKVLTDSPWRSAVELYRACGFTDLGSDGTDTHFVIPL
jgi:GNAT superfamily N-acetyltransferase